MTIGSKIKELRLQKQMTQSEVVGNFITRNMLSKIENGSSAPSIKTLEYLAVVLGKPVSYFLEDTDADDVGARTGGHSYELNQIVDLTEQLLTHSTDMTTRCISYCIKIHALNGLGWTEDAFTLIDAALTEKWLKEQLHQICGVAEEYCTQRGDFEQAYRYAKKRLEYQE